MTKRTSAELRVAADEFRRMSADGDDMRLQAALLLVAKEFDQEADRAEAGSRVTQPIFVETAQI